jgi:hypothetical protein
MKRALPYSIRKLPPGPDRDAALAAYERKSAKGPHEQDVWAAEKARNATRFTAVLHAGAFQRYRREAETFEAAVEEAFDLEHSIETNRRALIYAVAGTYTIPIDENVARLAGYPEEAIRRLFDRG